MVRIRLRRVGARNQASFRIVAADKESPRDGRFLEILGSYNPRTEPASVQIDEARLYHWLEHGAQPSESVRKVLHPHGTWDRWERYKGGEALEKLMEEAADAYPEVDPRTRRDDLIEARNAKKSSKKVKKAKAEAEAAKQATPDEAPEPAVEELGEEPALEDDAGEPDTEAEAPPTDEADTEDEAGQAGEADESDAEDTAESAEEPEESEQPDAKVEDESGEAGEGDESDTEETGESIEGPKESEQPEETTAKDSEAEPE